MRIVGKILRVFPFRTAPVYVLSYYRKTQKKVKDLMIKLDMKNMNLITIASFLMFLAGVLFYIYWGIRFGVWADVGIYSVTVFFVLTGILGMVLTLYQPSDKEL